MTASDLDNVPGVEAIRRKALLRQFGCVRRLASASVDAIASVPGVPGIGRRTAQSILDALNK